MAIDLGLDQILINSELDEAVQELDILFNTTNTELLGYFDYGTDFDQFLWDLDPSPNVVKEYIVKKLNSLYYYQQGQITYNVEVQYVDGEIRGIYYVVISLYLNEQNQISKVYRLQ